MKKSGLSILYLAGAVVLVVVGVVIGSQLPQKTTSPIPSIDTLDAPPPLATTSVHAPRGLTATGSAPMNGAASSIASLVDGLRERLEQQPDDMQGWVLLAKSYAYLQRLDDAKEALTQAQTLGFDQSLDLQALADEASAPRAATPPSPLPTTSISADYQAQKGSASILVSVKLAPELSDHYPPETPVFIYAKAANPSSLQAGPPLVALKKTLGDLPLYVALTDSMSLMPQRPLNSVSEVIVGARIALSGNPIRQPGDIEQDSPPTATGQQRQVSLLLGRSNSVAGG